jgi:hypothetical protein
MFCPIFFFGAVRFRLDFADFFKAKGSSLSEKKYAKDDLKL